MNNQQTALASRLSFGSTQNLRSLELGKGVEAQLVIRGNMLALPNVAEVVTWLDGVLKAFNKEIGTKENEGGKNVPQS